MIVGKTVDHGVPVALLCIPAEMPDEPLQFKMAFGFQEENGKPSWKSEMDFPDFRSAVKAFMGSPTNV